MAYGQTPSGYAGGGTQGKTSLADFLGETSNANLGTPDVDPNAFQYGGQAGGAAARQSQLSGLGAQGANYAGANAYQGAQNTALSQMQQQALGNDGGVAEGQLKQGAAQAAQEQFSAAASARGGGGNLAAAQMNAANQGAAGAANANFAAGQMRNQNQQAGIENSANYANSLAGQQVGMAQFNANLQQGYEGMNNQVGEAQLQAQGNQQQLQSQNQLAQQQQAMQQGQFNGQQNAGLVGSVMGAAGSVAGALGSLSDENAKHSIRSQSGLQSFYLPSSEDGKTNVLGQSGSKPGGGDMFDARTYTQSGGNPQGEEQLAARDAHTANFKQLGTGMGDWSNVSNANPWSKESDAAKANLSHFFGQDKSMGGRGVGQYGAGTGAAMLSDEDAKTEVAPESEHVTAEPPAEDQRYIGAVPSAEGLPEHTSQPLSSADPRDPGYQQPVDEAADRSLQHHFDAAWDNFYSTHPHAKDPRSIDGFSDMSLEDQAAAYKRSEAEDRKNSTSVIDEEHAPADAPEAAPAKGGKDAPHETNAGDVFSAGLKGFKSGGEEKRQEAPKMTEPHIDKLSFQRHDYQPHQMPSDERGKSHSLAMAHDDQKEFDTPKNAVQDFTKSIKPSTYKYKNPGINDGETRLGFMAQDIERSSTGKDLVKDTPAGKVVDVKALSSANTAAVGEHEERLTKLEKLLAKSHKNDHPGLNTDDDAHLVSDTAAKKDKVKADALEEQAAKMRSDMEGKTNGFEWMNDQDTAVRSDPENGTIPARVERPKAEPRQKPPVVHPALHAFYDQAEADSAPENDEQPTASNMPAGDVVKEPKLEPEKHGVFSVYDNGTELPSDTRAKKEVLAQGAYQQGKEDTLRAAGVKPQDPHEEGVKAAFADPRYDTKYERTLETLHGHGAKPVDYTESDPHYSKRQNLEGIRHIHHSAPEDYGFEESHPEVGTDELHRHIDALMASNSPKATVAPRTYDPHADPDADYSFAGTAYSDAQQPTLQSVHDEPTEEAREVTPKRGPRGYTPRTSLQQAVR